MKTSAHPLDEVLSEWKGEMSPPPRLRSAITATSLTGRIPLQAYDRAFRADLEELKIANADENSKSLKHYLGWTVQTLTQWDPQKDQGGCQLMAALIAADTWNRTNGFWSFLIGKIEDATLLSRGLGAVLKMAEPTAVLDQSVPIWEREHLAALQNADNEANWEELSKLAAAFQNLHPVDPVIKQSVIGLSLLDRARLVSLTDTIQKWLEARSIVQVLPLSASLSIAIDSKSRHIKFAAVSLLTGKPSRTLARDEIEAASALLLQLSGSDEWPKWLAFFNKFPVRNPTLQIPLGRALLEASPEALVDYVNSIELFGASAEGRLNVAECLSTFSEAASERSRRTLFESAFERWTKWNFGAEKKRGLFSFQRSELDYGVLSWLGEFCDVEWLEKEMLSIEDHLQKIDQQWFSSLPELQTTAKRLLSRYMLFAVAKTKRATAAELASDDDLSPWLPVMGEYFVAKHFSNP